MAEATVKNVLLISDDVSKRALIGTQLLLRHQIKHTQCLVRDALAHAKMRLFDCVLIDTFGQAPEKIDVVARAVHAALSQDGNPPPFVALYDERPSSEIFYHTVDRVNDVKTIAADIAAVIRRKPTDPSLRAVARQQLIDAAHRELLAAAHVVQSDYRKAYSHISEAYSHLAKVDG